MQSPRACNSRIFSTETCTAGTACAERGPGPGARETLENSQRPFLAYRFALCALASHNEDLNSRRETVWRIVPRFSLGLHTLHSVVVDPDDAVLLLLYITLHEHAPFRLHAHFTNLH